MANSMFLFDFEHINEDQLRDIIERVKRDKRRRRESADWLAYSSRKKEEIRCKTDISRSNLTESVHRDSQVFNQSPIKFIGQKYVAVPETVDYLQIVSRREHNYVQLVDDAQGIRHTLQKICSIRQSISEILDSILSQSELKVLKENIFRGTPMKFEESEIKTSLKNYRCRILRLDYQLVMDMRKLSQNIAKNDLFLDILSKCHSTASKLLQVFVNGWHGLMEMNQIKEKFCDLLKSVIILSRVCKTICVKIGGLTGLDGFMIDVLDKKCNTILHAVNKEYNEESQEKKSINAEEEMKVKKMQLPSKKHQSTKYIDLMKADPVSIPIKTFKKLAKKHFDGRETRIMYEKHVKMLSKDDPSRRSSTKICQGKKAKHSSNVIHRKTSVNASESEENEKPYSSSRNQDIPCLESEFKIFDMESFSKKLYSTLEKEICTNMKCIFNNLSFGQLQIYQTAGQNNDQHLFYNDAHLEILEKLKKSLHAPELEEIPLEIEFGSLHGKKEVMEASIDNPKQNEDCLSLKNEEGEYVVLQRQLSGPANHPLQLTATPHNCKNISKEVQSSSGNKKFVGGEEKLLAATERESARGLELWDAVGSISEKLIAECLKSIGSQLDYCILQNIFDQEFL